MTAPPLDGATVLVVGGTGFIGSHALPELVRSGAVVYATCRSQPRAPATPGVHWVESDLTWADCSVGWPKRCDAVIYLAQSHAWRSFPDGADDVFQINVRGPFQAIEYARKVGARRFIFASSGSVYGNVQTPAQESGRFDPSEPRSLYSASKIAAELMLHAYEVLMHVMILRLFTPYGAGQAEEMLIPRLVRRTVDGAPITLDAPDGIRLNPVAVADVVATILRCLTLDQSATMNVAGPEVLTLREIGERLGRRVGRPPVFETQAGPAPTVVGDTAALAAILGWTPQTRFPDGLGQ